MSKDIPIKEAIEDKKSWFNVKRFKIGTIDVNRPEKALDLKSTSKENFDKYIRSSHPFNFFEISKIVSKFEKITALQENEDPEINSFFGYAKWRDNKPMSLNFTFNFNPFNYVKKIEEIDYFFNFYHAYSNPFLFVPNIKIKTSLGRIIDIDKYIQFVDESFTILNQKNSKPIFVPVSLRMNIKEQREILEHYTKKEYFNYCFDFEGKHIDKVHIGRLRQFNSKLKELGYFDKAVLYYTNINRVIASIPGQEKNPASDVLASITGANIIGVNRKPQRGIKPIPGRPIPKPKIYPPDHIFRVFDNTSYYYLKSADKKQHIDEVNRGLNAINLDNEFESQTIYFLKNLEIEKYLDQKEMLKQYLEGAILKSLIKK
jgi:hypothetical protein